jgi:hypothetical protein
MSQQQRVAAARDINTPDGQSNHFKTIQIPLMFSSCLKYVQAFGGQLGRAIVAACDMWPYAVSVLQLSCAVTLTVQLQHPSLPSGYDALLLGLSR